MADEEKQEVESTEESQEEPKGAPAVTDPVDDDEYEDVLYAALKNIYDEFDDPPEGGEKDEGDEEKPAKKKVDPDSLTTEELKAQLAKTNETLKAVVRASLAEREEKHAIDTWNSFLEEASETERGIAKSMAFEVDDAEGMKLQIEQVKRLAAGVEKLITEEVEKRSTQSRQTMQTRYGIMTPEPEGDMDVALQDKKDLASGDYAKVIARRFARRGRIE